MNDVYVQTLKAYFISHIQMISQLSTSAPAAAPAQRGVSSTAGKCRPAEDLEIRK